jgi:NADH-quinone oxidoreductase subunit A
MLEGYFPVLLLLAVAIFITIAMLVLGTIFGPRNPTAAKLEPYEGGVPQIEATPQRFPVKFLEVAMIFLIFDIETVAFFPWAVMLGQLKVFALIEMGIFLLILGFGYIYLWKKGAFDWE